MADSHAAQTGAKLVPSSQIQSISRRSSAAEHNSINANSANSSNGRMHRNTDNSDRFSNSTSVFFEGSHQMAAHDVEDGQEGLLIKEENMGDNSMLEGDHNAPRKTSAKAKAKGKVRKGSDAKAKAKKKTGGTKKTKSSKKAKNNEEGEHTSPARKSKKGDNDNGDNDLNASQEGNPFAQDFVPFGGDGVSDGAGDVMDSIEMDDNMSGGVIVREEDRQEKDGGKKKKKKKADAKDGGGDKEEGGDGKKKKKKKRKDMYFIKEGEVGNVIREQASGVHFGLQELARGITERVQGAGHQIKQGEDIEILVSTESKDGIHRKIVRRS
jgi:hypothetical protein